MMQPSVHTTFSLWSGVFFLVLRMAEYFSGNSNNCFVRVGEVTDSIPNHDSFLLVQSFLFVYMTFLEACQPLPLAPL